MFQGVSVRVLVWHLGSFSFCVLWSSECVCSSVVGVFKVPFVWDMGFKVICGRFLLWDSVRGRAFGQTVLT